MKSNIVIVGANSQLGLSLKKTRPQWQFVSRQELDLCETAGIAEYFSDRPSVLINFSAYTAVDLAEKNRTEAEQLNSVAVGELAKTCETFIHISTDYVFSGQKSSPYVESDVTAPVNYYGETKLRGELAAFRNNKKAIVVRTSWLYSEFNQNFVKRILELAMSRDQLAVLDDQLGSPTYAGDLAAMIAHIAENPQKFQGEIFHYSNLGECTWYGFTKEILRLAGLNTPLRPITSAEFKTAAARPKYSVFDKTKIMRASGLMIPSWQQSLEKFLRARPASSALTNTF